MKDYYFYTSTVKKGKKIERFKTIMIICVWKYFDVETQHASNPLSRAEQIIIEIRLGKNDENRKGTIM